MRIALFFFLLCMYGCNSNRPSSPGVTDTTVDTTKFFQVKDFIQSQVSEVNKIPFFIYRIDIYNGRKDSVPINNQRFSEAANEFIKPDINDPSIKHFYTENVFHDQTTKTYTLSYTTTNKDLPVQNIDVLLLDDAQTVKRIFIRKFYNYADSSAIEQLSWKPGESFHINRLVQMKDKNESSHEMSVVWNEKRQQ